MSRLSRYQSTLNKWGLPENPFRATPPDDPKKLAQIFYGRDRALEVVIPALYEGRNILVRGAWGIGKTTLILNLIYQLQQEVAELNEQMLVLYLGSIPGENPTDFYRALLLAVADSLADIDKEAKDIANTVLGFSVQRSKTTTEGQVKLGVLSFGRKKESPSNQLTPNANADPYPLVLRLLDRAEENYSRIVIAIDDFDKKDPIVVQTINYLNSVFRKIPRNDCHPFTEEVIELITGYAQGFPRQLNTICEKVLRQAASDEYEIIDETAFSSIWQTLQQEFTYSLSPQFRHLLYVAYQVGGISEDISDRDLDKLDVITFVELLPQLNSMEEQGLLIRQEDESGYRFLPSKLFLPQSEEE